MVFSLRYCQCHTVNQKYFGMLQWILPGHTDYHKYYILARITVYRVVCEILAFHNIAGEVFFLLGYPVL